MVAVESNSEKIIFFMVYEVMIQEAKIRISYN